MVGTYAQSLGVLGAMPLALGSLVAALPREVLGHRPSADGWSPLEVLDHLRHVEDAVIGARIRLMLQEDHPLLEPAPPPGPPADDPAAVLAAWKAARAANLDLLRGLTEEQLQRVGTHRRYGDITVREHVVEWAYHDLDHLRQILAAFQTEMYPAIGSFQALYPQPC